MLITHIFQLFIGSKNYETLHSICEQSINSHYNNLGCHERSTLTICGGMNFPFSKKAKRQPHQKKKKQQQQIEVNTTSSRQPPVSETVQTLRSNASQIKANYIEVGEFI